MFEVNEKISATRIKRIFITTVSFERLHDAEENAKDTFYDQLEESIHTCSDHGSKISI